MSSVEIILLVGFSLSMLLGLVLLVRLRALSKPADTSHTDEKLIALKGQFDLFAGQADVREKAIREEFKGNREEITKAISELSDTLRKFGQHQTDQQEQFRKTLDSKMNELRTENSQKLDEMRKTVDEKLQTTLEKRLSESFKTVSERLEAVHKGLGEMQNLATGVGDLKRVLTNVKSRGTFGEVQLKILIEDFLTPDQFIENYDCGFTSGQKRVEFGVRMPGDEQRYLPVDSKFPTEDYERVLSAVEAGDKEALAKASSDLSRQIKLFAKDIATKYINPPITTNEAILFVPTEGLYAELLRVPGLVESIQRDHAITIAGPTNFQVLLSTFRMGYQQAVMQEQAAEVLKILGAVKNEFSKYGDQITAMTKSLDAAQRHVEKLDIRKRVMLKALKGVEALDGSAGGDVAFLPENAAVDDEID